MLQQLESSLTDMTANESTSNSQQKTCAVTEYMDKVSKECKPLQIYFGSFDQLFSVTLNPSGLRSNGSRRELLEFKQ